MDFRFDPVADCFHLLFPRVGIDNVFLVSFLADMTVAISVGKTPSAILIHDCFKGEICMIPKDLAIKWLGLSEDSCE